jgi:hypothetical protein
MHMNLILGVRINVFLYISTTGGGGGVEDVEMKSLAYLTSVVDEGEWAAVYSRRFTPGEGTPGTYWVRGGVGPEQV